MKYLFLFLISGLMMACNNTDQQAGNNKSDSTKIASMQWIDSVDQDLNKVNEGQVLEISWRFKNVGDVPLVISDVRPGCGCTGAEKPKEPVAPGKEGVIKAQFNTSRYPGTQHKQVYVTSNARSVSGSDEQVLSFTVDVIPKK
jgi:hypothetical protein